MSERSAPLASGTISLDGKRIDGLPPHRIARAGIARNRDALAEIDVQREGSAVRVGITRVHMEEDAGKSVHDRFPGAIALTP